MGIPRYVVVEWAREMVRRKVIGVNRICTVLGISKATYYACRDPRIRFEEKYEHIKKHIRTIIAKHPKYGVERIKAALAQDKGLTIGRDTLGKLLKVWELSLPRKIRKSRPSLIQKILESLAGNVNLLIRTSITEPFQAITSDISEIWYGRGTKRCYLCVHKDVLGQLVYGSAVRKTKDTALVMASLKRACKKIRQFIRRTPKDIIWHQDQGSQYTSYAYIEDTLKLGILSYSTKGTPTENPGQESFFGKFKDEWAKEMLEIEHFEEVERFIQDKIHYYNTKRLHTSIDYQTPLRYTKNFLKKNGKWFSKGRG